MKAYEVVGYADTDAGCCYCTDCGDPRMMEPIFANSEWDRYPVCDNCGEKIEDVCLTDEGRKNES